MTSPAPKQPLPIWLIVSLALNLLLVGGIAGWTLAPRAAPLVETTQWSKPNSAADHSDRAERRETRRAARDRLRETWRATRETRRELQTAREALKTAIITEPYDEARVATAFQTMRDAEARLERTTQDYLLTTLGKMRQEEREALAESMLRDRSRFRRTPRPSRTRENRNERHSEDEPGSDSKTEN